MATCTYFKKDVAPSAKNCPSCGGTEFRLTHDEHKERNEKSYFRLVLEGFWVAGIIWLLVLIATGVSDTVYYSKFSDLWFQYLQYLLFPSVIYAWVKEGKKPPE